MVKVLNSKTILVKNERNYKDGAYFLPSAKVAKYYKGYKLISPIILTDMYETRQEINKHFTDGGRAKLIAFVMNRLQVKLENLNAFLKETDEKILFKELINKSQELFSDFTKPVAKITEKEVYACDAKIEKEYKIIKGKTEVDYKEDLEVQRRKDKSVSISTIIRYAIACKCIYSYYLNNRNNKHYIRDASLIDLKEDFALQAFGAQFEANMLVPADEDDYVEVDETK